MSTRYTTTPPIPFQDFVQAKNIKVEYLDPPKYIVPHVRIYVNGNYLFAYQGEQGETIFERWGKNNIFDVFPFVVEEFGVDIYDEFGLKYPEECSA